MDHDGEGYTGPATVLLDGTEVAVSVRLRGHFQPIDGYYHWYGRFDRNEELSALVGDRSAPCCCARVSTPPFAVPVILAELGAPASTTNPQQNRR
ncbi:MAG: DUF4873 domain-containing protein [Thermocrispum sp.]